MNETVAELIEQFEQIFGPGELRYFFAPGRINLIGEHTDYTGGFVFPAALTLGTWAVVRPREDGRFRFASTGFPGLIERDVSDIAYRTEDSWANYPKGMVEQFVANGLRVTGADILFHGDIPNGAGLSSSASIELATGVALRALADSDLPMIELVKMAQRVENDYIGLKSGIMDQFAVGMGWSGHAMMLRCDTLECDHVPIRLGDYRLVIANTNKRRELVESKYNERWNECAVALRLLQSKRPTLTCLGELQASEWNALRSVIDSEPIRRRVDHVVQENARVTESKAALEEGDLLRFGQLMFQSHESLRDLYEVTGTELDALFEEARRAEGCIGTRMTGAGFGGCTISLVYGDSIDSFVETVGNGYAAKTGLQPTFYLSAIGGGAREMTEEVQAWRY
ncbi:MAG: galactokinase [Tumebacillaceae bacterium]